MTDQATPGPIGVWTFAFDGQPAGAVREAAAELEELGYGAVWFGEAFGRDTVGNAWLLLGATRRITVASGIANIALRTPIATATAERALNEAFPGRYLMGLGGHRVDDTPGTLDGYTVPSLGRAVTTMREYLDGTPGDRLVDAVVAYGDVEEIGKRVQGHLDAGADHVCLQVVAPDPAALPMEQWRRLADLH